VIDSALTNHGVVQTQRLGAYLADRHVFTRIYASDLQRAYMTAQAIANAQKTELVSVEAVRLPDLREQDFGSFEGAPWSSKRTNGDIYKAPNPNDTAFKPRETPKAMTRRGEAFLNDHLVPLLATNAEQEEIVAVVSHGLMLGSLWRCLLSRFAPETVTLNPSIVGNMGSMENHTTWANTGYLELEIVPATPASAADGLADPAGVTNTHDSMLTAWRMTVEAVNSKEHLSNLKKTRGIGSSAYDVKQSTMDGFLKKPKVVDTDASRYGSIDF
jgi:broad specificity phosphatase PhoE